MYAPTRMPDRGNNHIRRSPEKDPEESKPFTNVDTDGDVHFREPKKKTGCYLSKTALILIGFLLLILIVLVAVIIALISSKPTCTSCSEQQEPSIGALNSSSVDLTVKPTIPPDLPWSGIRLPRSLKPSFYNLGLKVDLEQFIFSGTVDIDVHAGQSTPYIVLHSNKLDIDTTAISVQDIDDNFSNLKLNGTFHVPENQFFVIKLQYSLFNGRRYRIQLRHFEGPLGDDLSGLYRSMYKDKEGNTRYLAASQLQPVDARKVFPCFDEPDLKANFSVAITHKQGYASMSNMALARSKTLNDYWITDYFENTPIMSTYLLAFVVADFDRQSVMTPAGLEIRIWSQPDMIGQTTYALNFAGKVYDFFSNYFGISEIVQKADHVAIPDFSAGAMENWGLVLYRETALLHDEKYSAVSNSYWVSIIMAHEIAHTWFGNMVTMRWWDDLWLNEGFANTLMYFALDGINKHWKVNDLQLVDNVYPAMTKDSLLTSHAISTPIIDPDDIPQYFDSISYDKGMAVLRLLRGFLGWENFKKGLKMYVHTYKFKNAVMSELWETFSTVVGHSYDVGKIMDTWTRQMGFPVVKVTQSDKDPELFIITQERFLLNPEDRKNQGTSPYNYKWEIPFSYRIQSLDNLEDTGTVWMHSASATITVPFGSWVLGNVDYMGFYRTNYDEAMWRKLIIQLKADPKVFSAANRAGLISDAFNLARANQLSYEVALNLSLYLDKEDEYVPWRAFLDSIHFLQGMLATSDSYGLLQRYIQNLVAPQYRRVGTSDQGDLLARNLRKILVETAANVEVPDAVSWARRSFDDWIKYNTRIPPDYAGVIYAVGVKYGGEKEWNYLWDKAHQSRVASEAGSMMSALGATQEPWLLWRYARWTLDSKKIRMQDVRNHFQYYANTPMGRSIAMDFLLTTWDEINAKFGVDVYLIRDVIHFITSLVNTEFGYNQLEQLYRDRPPAGVASKAAQNSLALIRSNINWMKYNHDTIHKWLVKNTPPIAK